MKQVETVRILIDYCVIILRIAVLALKAEKPRDAAAGCPHHDRVETARNERPDCEEVEKERDSTDYQKSICAFESIKNQVVHISVEVQRLATISKEASV